MKFPVVLLLFLLVGPSVHAQSSLTITSEPNAIVWIDEIRRGMTDESGKLTLTKVSAGRHSVRVRANGFKETTAALLPGRRALAVKLLPATDPAELKFQEAETAREKARLENAADLYREAIELRPAFPAAQVGLRAAGGQRPPGLQRTVDISLTRRLLTYGCRSESRGPGST